MHPYYTKTPQFEKLLRVGWKDINILAKKMPRILVIQHYRDIQLSTYEYEISGSRWIEKLLYTLS